MKILITGGSGLIGSSFIRYYSQQHQFTVTTRSVERVKQQFRGYGVDVVSELPSAQGFTEFDAVINLQGAGIADKRWTAERKQELQNSRWQITEALVQRIKECPSPPVLLSGSAIGVYGPRDDEPVSEEATPQTYDFAAELCQQWESIALSVQQYTRVVCLRTGVVLDSAQGALPRMALPYKLGLGGPMGSGKQMMSWIHIEDIIRALEFILQDDSISGPVNLTAPNPTANKQFSQTLAKTLHRPHVLFVPSFALNLMLGEMASMLLEGQAVVPKKLEQAGFHFNFPQLQDALADLL
tara:strand:+ start:814 stop:1704 length:891 start_codon:yes stop_codon:yes gene_type:complete